MTPVRTPLARGLVAAGALLAACAVALSAYASHATTGDDRSTLQVAAVFAFGHGVALAALASAAQRRLGHLALSGLLLGTVLFSGALALSRLADMNAGTAPFGGTILIASWVLYALDALRKG